MRAHLTRFVSPEEIDIPVEVCSLAPTAEERENEEAALRRAEESLLLRHMELRDTKIVEEGCVAALSLKSEASRYDRANVYVTVGLGLYSEELEKALVGRQVGEVFSLTVGSVPVSGQVLACQERLLPKSAVSLTFDMEQDGADSYAAWKDIQSGKAFQDRKSNRKHGMLEYLAKQMEVLCQPVLDAEEQERRFQTRFQEVIDQFTQVLQTEVNEQTRAFYQEQIRDSVRLEMEYALYGQEIAQDSCPEGEDPIEFYSSVYWNAAEKYCASILEKEIQE